MTNDDWKYGAAAVVGAAITALIGYGIYQAKRAEWEEERAQLEYKIQTLQGEIITQREYLGRLEEKISALERSDATHIGQLGAIGTRLDPIISEVENLLSQIGHESELFAELNSFLERLRRLKKQTFPTPIYVPVYN